MCCVKLICLINKLYITLAKACESAVVARSRSYTWASCEKRKGSVSWRRESLARANDVTTLGKREICTWHGHLALAQKGDSNPLWSDAIEHSLSADVIFIVYNVLPT